MTILRTRFKTTNREHLVEDGIQEAWLRACAGQLDNLPPIADSLHLEFKRLAQERGEQEARTAISRAIAQSGDETPLGRSICELLMYISTVAGNCTGDKRKTEARRGARWASNPARTLVYSRSGEGVVALGDSFHKPQATEWMALAKARLDRALEIFFMTKKQLANRTRLYLRQFSQLTLLAGESLDSAIEVLEPQWGPPPCSRISLHRHVTAIRKAMKYA